MDEDQLQELRRINLGEWVNAAGGPSAICRAKGLSKSYPSYISQTINGGSFASRGARNAEAKLGMPTGWLDQDHNNITPSPATVVAGSGLDLPQALGVVAQALHQMAAARRLNCLSSSICWPITPMSRTMSPAWPSCWAMQCPAPRLRNDKATADDVPDLHNAAP